MNYNYNNNNNPTTTLPPYDFPTTTDHDNQAVDSWFQYRYAGRHQRSVYHLVRNVLDRNSGLEEGFFEYIVIDEAHHIKNIDSILGARDADPSRAIGMFFFSFFCYCTNFFK